MEASLNAHRLIIPPIALPGGAFSAEHTVDLSAYQGRMVRVYISAAGEVEINPDHHSYWQVAEVLLPPVQYEQVETGEREETKTRVVAARRGARSIDAIPLAANESISDVGFTWARYRAETDYIVSAEGVTWIDGGRKPAAGSDYLVTSVTMTTVPIVEPRALTLDLAQHALQYFALRK